MGKELRQGVQAARALGERALRHDSVSCSLSAEVLRRRGSFPRPHRVRLCISTTKHQPLVIHWTGTEECFSLLFHQLALVAAELQTGGGQP